MIDKSESIKNLAAALLIFDAEVAKIGKNATNPFFKNKYASLSEIQDAVKEPLLKAGLTCKQIPVGEHSLYTILIHANTGEYIGGEYIMNPAKDDPQGNGSRITYQRRYSLGAVLGLNIDEDDDGNNASQPKQKPKIEPPKQDIPLSPDPVQTSEFQQALSMIQNAQTEKELMDVYNTFTTFRKEQEFIKALSTRKTELKRLLL